MSYWRVKSHRSLSVCSLIRWCFSLTAPVNSFSNYFSYFLSRLGFYFLNNASGTSCASNGDSLRLQEQYHEVSWAWLHVSMCLPFCALVWAVWLLQPSEKVALHMNVHRVKGWCVGRVSRLKVKHGCACVSIQGTLTLWYKAKHYPAQA